MSLSDKISEDLKAAMKAKDSVKVNTLRMIRAQIKDTEIEKGKTLSDDELLSVLNSAAKKRKEAIAVYEKSDRPELLEKEQTELAIIAEYLPKQLSADEIDKIVTKIIADVGATSVQDLGKVMGAAMKELKGKADGKLIQDLVRQKLS